MLRLMPRNLWKATPAIAISVAITVAVAGVAIALLAAQASREQKLKEISVQGQILAATVSAALMFDDRKAGEEYVSALKGNPELVMGAVYDATGSLFASYTRSGAPAPQHVRSQMSGIEGDQLFVVTPVIEGGKTLGSVCLRIVIEPEARRLARFGIIALMVIMVAVVIAVLGIAQAAMRRANTELAATNRSLKEQISEREKAESALRQAQKMEAIGHLTGGVAHDFNNLLQIVLSSIGILRRRAETWPLDTKAVQDFDRFTNAARNAGERAAGLTRQLLAFARRQPLEPKEIDVNKLVQGMSELLRRTLGEGIEIETVLGAGAWRTFADANQLESALVNLAVNARDAMGDGGKLTIETANAHFDEQYVKSHADLEAGQYVMIAMTDTGSGMTKDVLANAFEPFFTTKEIGQGTGLGLSQVYGFVKQSGGHVKIYSEPGNGTTVKIYLPRLSVITDMVGEPEDLLPPTGTRNETILVVEDEEDVRNFTVTMLRELGYGVIEAENGHLALRLLQAESAIQLLFTDVGLPDGLNGRRLADEARKLRPDLRVLFTSGYTRNAIVHGGRLDAGVALLSKPFTYAALAEKVREVLNSAPVS